MFTSSRTNLVDFARVDGIVAHETGHSCHSFSVESKRNVGPGPSLLSARSTFPIKFVLCAFPPAEYLTYCTFFLTSTMGCHVPRLFNTQQVMQSHENYRVKPTEIYIFIRGVGNSDASWPSKARHPVLNLGTFFSWAFFLPLASSRGTSASPPATRQNSPGI